MLEVSIEFMAEVVYQLARRIVDEEHPVHFHLIVVRNSIDLPYKNALIYD
jgi:hypothetical protein